MKRRFGLLGERLSHSFSPMIHAEFGDYEYKLYEKKPEELDAFFGRGDFDGLNVTVPFKKDIMRYCGSLSETAQSIGSVNTLTRLSDGAFHGDNTDYFGFAYLLKKTGVDPAEGKTIVLGSGGSSLTVQAVLRHMGAKEVVVIARNGPDNYDNVQIHRDAILIVNTTPVGMFPNNGVSPLADLGIFHNCRAVIDLIYNPARTELLLQAKDLGIPGTNGLIMLVAQAKKSAEQFIGSSIPDTLIDTIASKIARQTRNIVLIGMPGSGKSSVGAALADKMSREFADTDEFIANTAGKPVPDIINEGGEEVFRDMESDALKELCKRDALVVATGGGIVKRQENRNTIRQNGVIVFLDRDIDQLPVSGRPLSEREGIAALAKERLPLYSLWSDFTVPVRGAERTAEDIYEWYHGGVLT